jgi:DNA recombination protein RmuC
MELATFFAALGCLVVGLLAGLLGGLRAGRAAVAARIAALVTERDLLRERVTDLEAALGQDQEVAATLAPISASLQRVEAQVRTLEREHVVQSATLDEQLRSIAAGSEALRLQTGALAGALRSSTARGAWGEMQLRRVVEHAGMLDRVDFDVQVTITTEDGAAIRPDMVVHLPGGKRLVVDAKAPLSAMLLAAETADDPARQAEAARAHARAVRAHVDALAAKRYWAAFAPGPDLVVCFLPGEAVLAAACTADPALLDHAFAKRVVLATPTTLLTLMRSAAMGWQSDALSGNARELLQLGRDLHERLGNLGGHTERLGRSLAKAVEDYNAFVGTLERRVLVTARRLRELDLGDEELPTPPRLAALPRRVSAIDLDAAELG